MLIGSPYLIRGYVGAVLVMFLSVSSATAVQPITGILATYDNITDTNDNYSAIGGGSAGFPASTTYSMSFNVGSQNNLYLTGFEIGAEVFNFVLLADIINIERVDNSVITGAHHIVLYEQFAVGGTDVELKTSYAHTMEDALRSPIVNRGADNVFANQGDGNGNNNNIQRIDYIFPDGFPVFNNIDQRGFLIMDRGGNDRFKIAAITALDGNGKPSAFMDPVTVLETDWGDSGISIDTMVMRGYTDDGDVQHPSANVDPQPLAGVFVTWQTLGLQTNDFIYGYSLAANDVTDDGAFWTEVADTTYFPTNTSPDATFGGLDLISGGMMFFESDLDVTLGDLVWDDWNGDGIQDPGEPGLTNVLVHVYDANTNLAAITRTDSNGFWSAQGIGPGTFFVEFYLPTGYQFTVRFAGSNTNIDSNADTVTGRSELVTLSGGQTNRTIDAGMHLAPGDLRLTKSVNPAQARNGDEVVYALIVTNVGAEIVHLAQVIDPLPAALTFSGYGATAGAYTHTNGLWNIGTLGLGASATLTVTGIVNSGYGCSIITNVAEITRMDRPDTNTADNVDSATFRIECADLAVNKTVDDDNPIEGQAINFTITLTNNGPDDAQDIAVSDLLPAGLTYIGDVPSQGAYNDGTGIWTVGAVTNGGSATLVITAEPDVGTGGSSLTNTATITASSHDDPDPDNNEDDVVIHVQGADLAVTKTVDKPAASEGGTVIYTITVSNLGPSDTTGVEVTDPLVSGVTYVDDTPSQGSYNSGTGVWTVGALAVGSNATLQIEATVDIGTMGDTLTNTAAVTASDLPDPNPANDEDSATVSVSALEITKTSDVVGFALPGDTITYTIVITNSGATAHTGVTVTDLVPTGTTYVADSVTVSVNPPVGPGGTVTNVYNASTNFVVPAGVTNVIVQVWGAGGGAGKSSTAGNDAGGGGGGGGYARGSVAVTPGATNAVTVGAGGATATAGGGSWFGTAGTVFGAGGGAGGTGASVGAGGSANIGNQATFNGGSGGAGATGGAPTSRRGGGGGGSATATANGGNGQAGGSGSGGAGGTGTGTGGAGTQGAVNGNPGNAPGGGGGGGGNGGVGGAGANGRVIVTYTLPGGVGVTNDPPNLASGWTLAPGSVMTLTFDVTVNNPATVTEVINTASVTSNEEPTPLFDTVIDPLSNTDLAVFKSVSDANPEETDSITYTVIVTNNGPVNATGVIIEDVLPAGVSYVSDTPSQGSYNDGTGLWNVGTVNAGAFAELEITVSVDGGTSGSTITNTARLNASDVADSNPNNNEDSAVITVFGVDIGVGKTASPLVPFEKEQVVFTISVTNFGPNAATGVEVTDVLPAGVDYSSHVASQGSYNPGTGLWSIGALGVLQSETLTITAVVQTNTAGSSITNTATVTGVDQNDYNPANDTASVVVTPEEAPLDIFKDVSPSGAVSTGTTLTYTITVTNTSSQTQTGIAVTDTLPPGVTYVADSTEVDAPVNTNKTFRDEFNLRSYSQNDGTDNWTGNWIESEGDGPLAGNVQILFDTVRGATYTLRMAGGNQSLARVANLGGYTNASLSFDYRREGLEAGEFFAIEISSSGTGGPWTELDRFLGAATDTAYASTNYNINAFIATNTAIRFISTVGTMDATDIVWFDDVEISIPLRPHVTAPGGSPPNLASGYTLLPGEWMTITFDVTVNQPGIHTQLVNTASVTSDQMTEPRSDTAITPVNLAPVTLGDRVWFDANGNGVQDSAETNGFYNVPVALLDTNGTVIASTTTDTNGLYQFTSIPWGTYRFRFDLSSVNTNLEVTLAFAGSDQALDSNVTNGNVGGFAYTGFDLFTEGQTNWTIDLGIRPLSPTRAELSDVRGEWTGAGQVVWRTGSEVGTAGFFLYRVAPDTGSETRLNALLIPSAFEADGAEYRYTDPEAVEGGAGVYRVEEMELAGTTRDLGVHEVRFDPAPAAPRTVFAPPSVVTEDYVMFTSDAPAAPDLSDCLKVLVRTEGIYGIGLAAIADGLGLPHDTVQALAAEHYLSLTVEGYHVPWHYDVEGDRMVFFGRGADNWYTRDAAYWIRAEEGMRMPRRDPGTGTGESVFPVTLRFKEYAYPFETSYPRPGEFYYWDYVISGHAQFGARVLPIRLPGYTGGPVTLRARLVGWSETDFTPDHLAELALNGEPVGTVTFDRQDEVIAEWIVPPGIAIEGVNHVTVRGILQEGHSHSFFIIDWIEASYDRALAPDTDTIVFSAGDTGAVSAPAFSAPLVMSLYLDDIPVLVAESDDTIPDTTWTPIESGERFALIERDAVPMLTPQPGACDAWFMAWDNRVDYLIITTRALAPAAENLADHRRDQGLRVGVALFEDVCDLFAGGLRTPEAIPRLLRYAHTYWQEAPWLVALAGDGHFDYLHAQSAEINHLPPLLESTPRGLFASDGLLTDLNGDGVPDLAVGRLPARTQTELLTMINKIRQYEARHGQEWNRRLVVAADEVDGAGDFVQTSEHFASLASDRMTTERIYLDELPIAAARTRLMSEFNQGAGIIHYTGHGGPDNFSPKGLLRRTNVNGMNNSRTPLVIALSCLVGRFESPGVDSLGEVLIRRAHGGAVAVWGPSGLSRHHPAGELGDAFYRTVLHDGSGTLGLAVLRARRAIASSPIDEDTFTIYNLLGDPALKLGGVEGGHAEDDFFAQWRWERFTPDALADATVSGPNGDANDTGRVNLLKYAFGDELTSGGVVMPALEWFGAETDGDTVIVQWNQRRVTRDLEYRISVSEDLATWHHQPPALQILSVVPVPDTVMERVSARLPFAGHTLYIKLDVVRR